MQVAIVHILVLDTTLTGEWYTVFHWVSKHMPVMSRLGLSRLCSATFEQRLASGATFCGFSNLEQVLPFRAIFEKNIGLEHISSTKKVNDFVENLAFGSQQESALQDYLEASVVLRYNNAKRV